MPTNLTKQPMYLPNGGDPEQVNLSTLWQPGQLGGRLFVAPQSPGGQGAGRGYQLVKTDSTMSVAPYVGATAYWKDRANYLVTTDDSGRINQLAGVFTTTVTPGNYTCVQFQGPGLIKLIDAPGSGGPTAAGVFVIPSTTDGKADTTTSAPTTAVFGMSTGTTLPGSLCPIMLEVPQTT